MENFISSIAIIAAIIVMSGIQIALIIVFDSRVWQKLDRIVLFFSKERDAIVEALKRLQDEVRNK